MVYIPKEGDVTSEKELMEFLDWVEYSNLGGHVPAPDILRQIPKIGYRTSNGTVYAGLSPDTGKPMYVIPATIQFKQAKEYASALDPAAVHEDSRGPTKAELSVLFHNSTAIGDFNSSDQYLRFESSDGIVRVVPAELGQCMRSALQPKVPTPQ